MAFFDDFTKKVGKAAQIAAKKSSDLVEITKLNANISSQEDHIKENYRKMGEICFKLFQDGKSLPEDLTALCNDVVACQDKITTLHEKIAEIKEEAGPSVTSAFSSEDNKAPISFDNAEDASPTETASEPTSTEQPSDTTTTSTINFDKSSN